MSSSSFDIISKNRKFAGQAFYIAQKGIPSTTISNAVWILKADENMYCPHNWANMTLSTGLPGHSLDRFFAALNQISAKHPVKKLNVLCAFWIYFAIIISSTAFYIYKVTTNYYYNDSYLYFFLGSIFACYFVFLCYVIGAAQSQKSRLKLRQTAISNHLNAANQQEFNHLGAHWTCGEYSTFIQLGFQNPQLNMVAPFQQNLNVNMNPQQNYPQQNMTRQPMPPPLFPNNAPQGYQTQTPF